MVLHKENAKDIFYNPQFKIYTLDLPDMALLSGVVTISLSVTYLVTNDIVLLPSGSGTFQGTVISGAGGAFTFNADGQVVIDLAVEGNRFTIRVNLTCNKWNVEDVSRNGSKFIQK